MVFVAAVDPHQPFSKSYFTIVCPCGRALRAKAELGGSEITCWECHRLVPVPHRRASWGEAARALRLGWQDTVRAESVGLVALGGVLITGLLCVPRAGVLLGTGVLVAAAAGYGELVRRGGLIDGPVREEGPRRPGRLVFRALTALALGLGLGAPFLLSPGGLGHAARLAGAALVIAVVTLTVFTVATAAAWGRGPDGRAIGCRRLAGAARRHPLATATAIAVVPLAAVLVEGFLLAFAWYYGALCFLSVDLFPDAENTCRMFRIPFHGVFALGVPADGRFLRMYAHRLGQGYTLTGAIPPSLSLREQVHQYLWGNPNADVPYFLVRTALTLVITTVMLTALSLQARWLALIAALDSPRAGREGADSI
jgi:hypothetical protein